MKYYIKEDLDHRKPSISSGRMKGKHDHDHQNHQSRSSTELQNPFTWRQAEAMKKKAAAASTVITVFLLVICVLLSSAWFDAVSVAESLYNV